MFVFERNDVIKDLYKKVTRAVLDLSILDVLGLQETCGGR